MPDSLEKLLAHITDVVDDEASHRLDTELQKVNDLGTLLALARQYDDVATAGPLLRRALQINPKHEDALAMLADVLVSAHEVSEAESVVQALREAYPQNAKGVWLALQLLEPGEYFAKVERLARTLRELQPVSANGVLFLAKALALQGRTKTALDVLDAESARNDLSDFDKKQLASTRAAIIKGDLLSPDNFSWP